MHKLLTAVYLLASALSVAAQSPLTTTFTGLNAGSVGGAVYCDLTVQTPLVVTSIDINLATAASTTGSIEVYTCPNTYAGNETSAAAWTLLGSGTVTSNGPGTPSTVTLASPFPLTPGTAGYAFAGIGHSFRYSNGNGTNQTYSTAELTLNAGAASNTAFSSSPFTPRVVNTSIHYTVGAGNYATATSFGEGCYERYASFYEEFTGPIDLNGTSLEMYTIGTGYLVLPGGNQWYTPTSTPVAFQDNEVQQHALGFTLPYPGGSTTDIWISSNGFIYLTSQTSSGCCQGSFWGLLSSTYGPRLAGLWNDLDPSSTGGGSIYVDADPVAGTCHVTFDQVPRKNTSDLNTFQYYFDQAGDVELRYAACNVQTARTVIGWSPGAGNADPGSTDLSALVTLITAANDGTPLGLSADVRPVIGTTLNLSVDNVPASAILNAMIYGLTKFDPGTWLGSIGMPECYQYASMDSVTLLFAPNTTHAFSIPNDPALAGLQVIAQGASYDPAGGHNPAGALTSNGIEMVLDVN